MSAAPLAGRVALVTGGSRGLGRGIALRLARDGADCVVAYRRQAEQARAVAAEIEGLGRRALALPVDLGDPATVGAAITRAGEAWGRLDVLVANAAATAFRPLLEQGLHNVERTFAISVPSFIAAVQAAVPFMDGRGGRIVMISGIDSHQAMAGHGVLGAAKAAAESLVRSLAVELGPRGITVNGVSPGFFDSDSSRTYMERGLGLDYAEVLRRVAAATPVRRPGTVEEIAGLVAYLTSEDAGFLTGQTIIIDGGLTVVSRLSRLGEGP